MFKKKKKSKKICLQYRRCRFNPLGREDPLEKEMATYSRILAWEIPWTEVPGRLKSMGHKRLRHDLVTKKQHHDVKYSMYLTSLV